MRLADFANYNNQGLLSTAEYENFNAAVAFLDDDQLEEIVGITNGLSETDRNDFLKISARAEEATGDLLDIMDSVVEPADQKAFLEVGRNLFGDNLKNFIGAGRTAVTSTPGTFSKLVEMTGELQSGEREDFLKAAATAAPVVLNDLIDTTDKLDGLARKSFLSVASYAGLHLEGVIDMAENVLGKMPDKFIDIFTSATSAGKYLGSFVETFA